jgi:hypothetical protein
MTMWEVTYFKPTPYGDGYTMTEVHRSMPDKRRAKKLAKKLLVPVHETDYSRRVNWRSWPKVVVSIPGETCVVTPRIISVPSIGERGY